MYSRKQELDSFLNSDFYKQKLQLHNRIGVGFIESYDAIVDIYKEIITDINIDVFKQNLKNLIDALNSTSEMKNFEWDFSFNEDMRKISVILYHKELKIMYKTDVSDYDDEDEDYEDNYDTYFNEDFYTLISLSVHKTGEIIISGSDIKGIKMSYNATELINKYQHSHISTSSIGEWSTFCTGGADSGLYRECEEIFEDRAIVSEILYSSIILEVIRILEFESVEGGPYLFISRFTAPVSENYQYVESGYDINRFAGFSPNFIGRLAIDTLSKYKFNFDNVDFILERGFYRIKNLRQLEEKLLKTLAIIHLEKIPIGFDVFSILYRNINGVPKMLLDESNNREHKRICDIVKEEYLTDTCIMFKGKLITPKIDVDLKDGLDISNINILNFRILPLALSNFAQYLEKNINSSEIINNEP